MSQKETKDVPAVDTTDPFDLFHALRIRIEIIEECIAAFGTMFDKTYLDNRFKQKWSEFTNKKAERGV